MVAVALFAVYLFWGSTYLAIRICVESMPPFVLGGVRHTTAGLVLLGLALLLGERRPKRAEIPGALISGALTLGGGNGALIWAEQRVPSAIAAMVIATTPVWLIALDVAFFGARRPTPRVWLGMTLGLAGTLGLALTSSDLSGAPVSWIDVAALFVGAGAWALGSLFNRKLRTPSSNWVSSALQMISGGILMLLLTSAHGDWARVLRSPPRSAGLWALAYLIVVGSWAGYSAYSWLTRHVEPRISGTYAFVNPVVALALGYFVAGEAISLQARLACAVTVAGVALIMLPARVPARARAT